MKKIIIGMMLSLTALSLNAKCDWSKVNLSYGNTCNIYKFEVVGTVDTCNHVDIKVYKKGATTPYYTGLNRGFSVTFNDTGLYYVRVAVKNACCGGDTLFYNLIHVTCKPKPKCNWTTQKPGYTLHCDTVRFELGSKDTCVSYLTKKYTPKTGKTDTITRDRIYTHVFKDTGLFYLITNYHNKCTGCDTSIYTRFHITCKSTIKPKCNWTTQHPGYKLVCNSITYESGSYDTCIRYFTIAFHNNKVDTLSDNRVFKYNFKDTGIYYVKTKYTNKCLGCDTMIYTKMHVECLNPTSTLDIIKPEPKLMGMYDMLGRPVYNVRENEITIYLYSDGSTRKIIQK